MYEFYHHIFVECFITALDCRICLTQLLISFCHIFCFSDNSTSNLCVVNYCVICNVLPYIFILFQCLLRRCWFFRSECNSAFHYSRSRTWFAQGLCRLCCWLVLLCAWWIVADLGMWLGWSLVCFLQKKNIKCQWRTVEDTEVRM